MGNSSSKKYNLEITKTSSTTDDYKLAQIHNYNYKSYGQTSKSTDQNVNVTLVTHLTVDRLSVFEKQANHWKGDISVSIYLPQKEEKKLKKFISKSKVLKSRQNINYNLVYSSGQLYPINFMRNVALDNAQTEFVFLVDVDFIPDIGLFEHIKDDIKSLSMSTSRRALVVPAFESKQKDFVFPASKDELLLMMQNNMISTFHYQHWPKGQEATNYDKWAKTSESYTVEWEPSYEPFIIVRKDVPKFDRRFVGYGWDKVSHIMEMAASGYEFIVLPNHFIIHLPHEQSTDSQLFRNCQQFQSCFQLERNNFLSDLKQRYSSDNKVLKKYYSKTHTSKASSSQIDDEYAAAYRWSQTNQFKFDVFCIHYDHPLDVNGTDVTLVTQLTIDRLSVFESLSKRWNGPISAAFYLDDNQVKHLKRYVKESKILSSRTNIGYHVVHREGLFYPINYLRNIALNSVNTEYTFLVDVDFLPSNQLYQVLREKIITFIINQNKKRCFVVPAFEMQEKDFQFPETKDQLLILLKSNKIIPFYYNTWPTGHEPTDYDKWCTSTEPYLIKWKPDFEPYIVIDKGVPRYDNRFVGYGWNKISHIMEVAASGYEFMVLHDAYIIHVPHPDTREKVTFKNNQQYKNISKNTRKEFLYDFRRNYGDHFYITYFSHHHTSQDQASNIISGHSSSYSSSHNDSHNGSHNDSHNGSYNGSYNGSHNGSHNSSHNGSHNSSHNGSHNGSHNSSHNSSHNGSHNSSHNSSHSRGSHSGCDAGGDEDADKGSYGGTNDNGSCSSNQNSGNMFESDAIIDSIMDSMVAYN